MEIMTQEHLTSTVEEDIPNLKESIFSSLDDGVLKSFQWGALFLYLLSYFYASSLLEFQTVYLFPLAIGLILFVEYLANKLAHPFFQMEGSGGNLLETRLFLTMTLLQSLALSIWGFHPQMEFFQFVVLHASFVFYVLARTGRLTQGRLGIMVWFDSIQAFLILPFQNFLTGVLVFLQKSSSATHKNSDKKIPSNIKHLGTISLSILVAGMLVFFVWTQLSQVSENFFSLTSGIGTQIQLFFSQIFSSIQDPLLLPKTLFALPVSLYLYGLISGSLLGRKETFLTYKKFQKYIRPLQVSPTYTAYIVLGSLCAIYALFFLTGLSELNQLLGSDNIAAHAASSVAVAGFWQLVRVSLLNFAVLAAFYLLAKKPLWDQKGTRLMTTLLFIFASLLALLAGWKLFGIYIFLYGPTPLRLLSAWFVLVLLIWCMLTLIRLYKPIQAIRIGLLYALISFTFLCYLYPLLLNR